MSSTAPVDPEATQPQLEDAFMDPASDHEGEEGEGDNVAPDDSDDSSEEPEEDAEEERRIREGFIVDEDEDEDEDEGDAEAERRRRHKRRKRHHRRRQDEEEMLDEDDLDLMEENTGTSFKKSRLTRLRRGRGSESPPTQSSTKRKSVVASSEDDLDNDDLDLPQIQDIQRIWDDERGGEGEEDMDDFIEYDEPDEDGNQLDEEAREQRRKERKRMEKERRRSRGGRPELDGMDDLDWDEIHDVFGDGHEYDWALGDEQDEYEDLPQKIDMRYHDVFEPSQIKARHLTEDDDLVRAQDIPERMQLASSTLSDETFLSDQEPLVDDDIDAAADWVTQRISPEKTNKFLDINGDSVHLRGELVLAVTYALRQLLIQEFEVPFIWTHKRDYLSFFDVADPRSRQELLTLDELWRVYALGKKYRSFINRKKAVMSLYDRIGTSDEYFEAEIQSRLENVEMVADASEWLSMKFKDKKRGDNSVEFRFHDDEEQSTNSKKWKMPSRVSAYELAKKSVVAKLAQGFGLEPRNIVTNFRASQSLHFTEDPDLNPLVYAEQFADPDPTKAQPPEELLRRARLILATELGKDPLLRQDMRSLFQAEAEITVIPTERGVVKIDSHNLEYNFKYLKNKPVADMLQTGQFLHILQAEKQLLVTVQITLPSESKTSFERRLMDAFRSDNFSDATKAWNEERFKVVQDVLGQHLIPVGVKWIREYVREEVEDFISNRCAEHLAVRLNMAPFATTNMERGEIPSVLAVSWGKGDPHKDAVTLVFLDDQGRMRETTKIDNLFDAECKDEFVDLLKRRDPDVIVVGGFSMATAKLSQKVKELVRSLSGADNNGWGGDGVNAADDNGGWGQSTPAPPSQGALSIPVIYVSDDVARLFQHSARAANDFTSLSQTARYCVGLARYTQSPLNEFAALGRDITSITFYEDYQQMIPDSKLLPALERTLVDAVNKVGVDINRAINDPYYQQLLPFVCGLGPRKAQALVKKISQTGGGLINRDQFIKSGLLTTKIFLNAAAFLRISQDADDNIKLAKTRHIDEDVQDPLDDTRIHPEDYELARKMATDALELDEEDVHDEHPSHVISVIMQDPDNDKKLAELNLDEFAVSLMEASQDRKRHTLNLIRDELLRPYAEQRDPFQLPSDWDILTMLSGETQRTLRTSLIVSLQVTRVNKNFVSVRLDSGVDGIISANWLSKDKAPEDVVKKGQTILAAVVEVKMNAEQDQFFVELVALPRVIENGDGEYRRIKRDDAWDFQREEKDQELQARKKRAEVNRARRVIKHPNFHNFNTAQAEAFLEGQQRGDVVIRPSSKGLDHLAVTWKVDDGLYQHIDITEPNADPTGQTTGGELIVDDTHRYADLDELIVNHVQAMARRVEDVMAHDKFKSGTEDELHIFLKNFVAANPAKSIYGFTLNRKRPGHFSLCFLANKNSTVQTWPVRVTPEAYYLFDTIAVGVPELCDAFKVRHLHQSQNMGNSATGGKTPYGAGGRTPGRLGNATPGHMSSRQIPGHMSSRQPAVPVRTPNPYGGPPPPGGSSSWGGASSYVGGGGSSVHPSANPSGWGATPAASGSSWGAPAPYGGATPAPFGGLPPPPPSQSFGGNPPQGTQTPMQGYPPNGYQTPMQPPAIPAGIHPSRAHLLQQGSGGSGWGGGNQGWGR